MPSGALNAFLRRHSSEPCWQPPWSGSRFSSRLRLWLRRSCSVIFALALIAFAALNLKAEWLAYEAFNEPGLTAEERYALLMAAGRTYPYDINLRWAAENFRLAWNEMVKRGGPDK